MSIISKQSSAELTRIVTDSYVGKYYEIIMVNSVGLSYVPGDTVDSAVLNAEVTEQYGYQREVVFYELADILPYADSGVSLARKGVVFSHDGGGNSWQWTHYAQINGSGNVTALDIVTTIPSGSPNGVNGTYLSLPVTAGTAGKNLTVDLTITNDGATTGDWALTINKPGYNFVASESLTVTNAALIAAGATAGTGDLVFSVDTVTSGDGAVVNVATLATPATLSDGNQAIAYVDKKVFGVEP